MYLFSKEDYYYEVELPKDKVIIIMEKNINDYTFNGWVEDNIFKLSLMSLYWRGSNPVFKGNISQFNNTRIIQGNMEASVFNIVIFSILLILFVFFAIAMKNVLPLFTAIFGSMIDMAFFYSRKDKLKERLAKMFYKDIHELK